MPINCRENLAPPMHHVTSPSPMLRDARKRVPRCRRKKNYGAGFSFTMLRTFFSYACLSFLKRLNASACAGESGFGSSSSDWMPSRISLIVIAGFQPSSSLRMLRQTVPEGYTFGWKRGGVNLPALISISALLLGETAIYRTFWGLCGVLFALLANSSKS